MIHQKHTCISDDNVLIVILLDLWLNGHRSINMRSLRNEHSNQSHSQDYIVFWKIKRCKDYDRFEIPFYKCWFTVISFCDNCHMWMRVFETFNCESYSNFFWYSMLPLHFELWIFVWYVLKICIKIYKGSLQELLVLSRWALQHARCTCIPA